MTYIKELEERNDKLQDILNKVCNLLIYKCISHKKGEKIIKISIGAKINAYLPKGWVIYADYSEGIEEVDPLEDYKTLGIAEKIIGKESEWSVKTINGEKVLNGTGEEIKDEMFKDLNICEGFVCRSHTLVIQDPVATGEGVSCISTSGSLGGFSYSNSQGGTWSLANSNSNSNSNSNIMAYDDTFIDNKIDDKMRQYFTEMLEKMQAEAQNKNPDKK